MFILFTLADWNNNPPPTVPLMARYSDRGKITIFFYKSNQIFLTLDFRNYLVFRYIDLCPCNIYSLTTKCVDCVVMVSRQTGIEIMSGYYTYRYVPSTSTITYNMPSTSNSTITLSKYHLQFYINRNIF